MKLLTVVSAVFWVCFVFGVGFSVGILVTNKNNPRIDYPVFSGDTALDNMITRLATEYGEDPYYVAGMIHKENRTWNLRLKGRHGEIGLCQILYYNDCLYNPEINIRIALLKLQYFKQFFPTDYYQAYNVGFQNIKNNYQRDVFRYADSFRIMNRKDK